MSPVPVPDGSQTLSDINVSIIRTAVPTFVGSAIAWLLTRGFDLSAYENAVNIYLVPACVAGYYSAARWLESKAPVFGVLLGYKRQPVYAAANQVVTKTNAASFTDNKYTD